MRYFYSVAENEPLEFLTRGLAVVVREKIIVKFRKKKTTTSMGELTLLQWTLF